MDKGIPMDSGTPLDSPMGPDIMVTPGQPQQTGTPQMVTLPPLAEPSAPPPAEEEPTYEVKVRGETVKVPLSELMNGYSRQEDYTRSKQELAREKAELQEVANFRNFLRSNPQLVSAVEQLVEQQRQQGPQFQQPQGQPPMVDPYIMEQQKFMLDQLGEVRFQMDVQQLTSRHPEANADDVVRFAVENNLPNLEHAWMVMNYPNVTKQAADNLTETIQQKQAAGVEARGSGPPAQAQVDISGKKDQELWRMGANYYPLEI